MPKLNNENEISAPSLHQTIFDAYHGPLADAVIGLESLVGRVADAQYDPAVKSEPVLGMSLAEFLENGDYAIKIAAQRIDSATATLTQILLGV